MFSTRYLKHLLFSGVLAVFVILPLVSRPVEAATEQNYDIKVMFWCEEEKSYVGQPNYYKYDELELSQEHDLIQAGLNKQNPEDPSVVFRLDYSNSNSNSPIYILYPHAPNGYGSGKPIKSKDIVENNRVKTVTFSAFKVGWIRYRNEWTYAYSTAGFARGWVQLESKWYYFEPESGEMKHDTYVNGYYLGADGVWVPNK